MQDPGQARRSLDSGTMRATVRITVHGADVSAFPCGGIATSVLGRDDRQAGELEREIVTEANEVPEGVPTDESGEHFKPTGTIFVLTVFVATLILLWGSVYVILLARGVTVQ